MEILILLALACAPGAFIIGYVYLRDRFEPEPVGLLAKSFVYGILSVLVTVLVSLPIMAVLPIDEKSLSQQAFHAFILVAFIEEGSKFLFVRGILYRNKNFNEPYDGIIYAIMVGMGFATLENILYSFQHGVGVALFRMFTAVPAHASFAVLMGYFLGKEKFEKRSNLYGAWALGSATLLHGAYDYCLFVDFVPGIWIGAGVSLLIGVRLSLAAIRSHQAASPFRPEAVSRPHSPGPEIRDQNIAEGDARLSVGLIKVVCPACGFSRESEPVHVGHILTCPACTEEFTVANTV